MVVDAISLPAMARLQQQVEQTEEDEEADMMPSAELAAKET